MMIETTISDCDHQQGGWCLNCVSQLWDDCDRAEADVLNILLQLEAVIEENTMLRERYDLPLGYFQERYNKREWEG